MLTPQRVGLPVSGPHTVSFPWKYRTVSAGISMDGCDTVIDEPNEHEHGEVNTNTTLYLNRWDPSPPTFGLLSFHTCSTHNNMQTADIGPTWAHRRSSYVALSDLPVGFKGGERM